MIIVQRGGWPGLDLIEVENLRRWIEYNPKCYVEKLKSGELDEQKLEDDLTLLRIKKLYVLIKKIDGKLNKKQRHYNLRNPHSLEEDKEYQKLVDSIPNLNISYYANLKLTDEERQIAYDFMKQCNKENSNEMMKYAENFSNFFIGSYMIELLRYHPESDYIHSTKNLDIMADSANKRIRKRMKEIRMQEQDSWEHARHRVIR